MDGASTAAIMSADLLKAASAALVLLHSIQEQTEGAHNMPWPEIDALEQAVTEANNAATITGQVSSYAQFDRGRVTRPAGIRRPTRQVKASAICRA